MIDEIPPLRHATQTAIDHLPGYYADLHWRRAEGWTCMHCGHDWPCAGANRQLLNLRPYIARFWLDEEHFDEMKAMLAKDEARDLARKARQKAAAEETPA